MAKQPILSICIPTFNRGEALSKLVKKYLSNENKDFEIVVVDNASSDESVKFLKEINDDRLKIYQNEINIGSFYNICKTLTLASGKYAMMLMDKDLLDVKNIDKIIAFLKEAKVAAGIFLNNSESETVKAVYIKDEVKKITDICFNGNHPSGIFFNKNFIDIEKAVSIMERYDTEIRPYATDFLFTMLAKSAPFVIVDIEFVHFVLPPFDGLKHSFTYSLERNNIFFLPEYRFKVFENFIKFLNEIDIGFFKRINILKKLAKKMLKISVDDYLWVLEQENICNWYNITSSFIETEKQKNLKEEFINRFKESQAFNSILEHKLVEMSLKKKAKT